MGALTNALDNHIWGQSAHQQHLTVGVNCSITIVELFNAGSGYVSWLPDVRRSWSEDDSIRHCFAHIKPFKMHIMWYDNLVQRAEGTCCSTRRRVAFWVSFKCSDHGYSCPLSDMIRTNIKTLPRLTHARSDGCSTRNSFKDKLK